MRFTDKTRRWTLPILLVTLLLLSGCDFTIPTSTIHSNIPTQSAIHRFNLSARQGLRDLAGDFTVRTGGADTGIALIPDERVEIFATGSANVQPGGKSSGPEGDPTCRQASMPAPALPCYSVIYSIGINGPAGLVGTHTDFTLTTEGNLFLGVNSSHLTNNSGSFQITVLTIPAGTMTGLWASPTNGFAFQGNAMPLSALIFAQGTTIQSVEFTAANAGQGPAPICQARYTGGDTYSCQWDFTVNGSYPGNGPISFGFIVRANTGKTLANPDGIRSGLARYVRTEVNDIYAGYSAINYYGNGGYQKVTGRWTVPEAHCSPGENSLSAIWVGMVGTSDQSKLTQIATSSNCQSGIPEYDMGWEVYPTTPAIIVPKPVDAGDTITATVSFHSGTFDLLMDDFQQGWHFAITQQGDPADTRIAECIVEAPTIVNSLTDSRSVAQLTNFGTASVFCQANDKAIGSGAQNYVFQMYHMDTRTPKATTSELDRDGSTFTVKWVSG
ncbi:MAG: hypothetical protein JOZ18_07860 [Chloroflexi bacterium]|nr:hypothetical protein [Chloroflexota bacterium]